MTTRSNANTASHADLSMSLDDDAVVPNSSHSAPNISLVGVSVLIVCGFVLLALIIFLVIFYVKPSYFGLFS